MTLKQQEHAKELLKVLNNLQNTEDKNTIPVQSFECKYEYILHLIPANFQHPLKDIVSSVETHFFLVSKIPDIPSSSLNDSTDSEEDEIPKAPVKLPEISVKTKQHVLVGTPISQQVLHLFWQKNFHDREAEITEKYLDLSSLVRLELKDARYLASLYGQCVKQQKNLPEMWLLCDRANPQRVNYMGVVPSLANNPQQISTVMVRSEDFNDKNPGFNLTDQKKQHMMFHRANHPETHGYARYNVYGTLDESSVDPDEPQSNISIEFAWDGVREILQPPPSSSNAVLNIFADPEDVQTILPEITKELNILGGLFGIVKKKSLEEAEFKETTSLEEKFDRAELKKNVLEFLDKLTLQSMGQPGMGQPEESETVTASTSTAISFTIAEALHRQDLDNTESLWGFLKELPSPSQMMFCLDVIFEQLLLGKYQPVLYADNQTQIAKLMKEGIGCSTDKERAEVKVKIDDMLTPVEGLQAIIDIAMDKLQNDYINYFIKQELVTKDLLEYFIAKGISASEKLQRLLKLHCILSLVALALLYVRIDPDALRQLVPAALKFYKNHSHTEIPVYSLSLPAFSTSSSDVKNKCVRECQPQAWVAAITTTNQHITMMQLDAKDPLETFAEGGTTLHGNSYSITTASVLKVCI
jgi:hypothetical protein